MSAAAVVLGRQAIRELHGVVVSAGLMEKTVKVRVGGQKWNSRLKKYFDAPRTVMVHDPNSSLRTGDVVAIASGWKTSRHKRHVVKHIIAPHGIPIDERPPVPTHEDNLADWEAQRKAKEERRAAARELQRLARLEAQTANSSESAQGGKQRPETSLSDVD